MTPRIALLIAGQPRTMEHCFPSMKRHILDVCNPDVFICTDPNAQLDRIQELYTPAKMEVVDKEESLSRFAAMRTTSTMHDMLSIPVRSIAYKLWRANQLKKLWETGMGERYDIVIISRFDLKIHFVPPIENVEENTIYIPRNDGYPAPHDSTAVVPGIHWAGYSAHLCYMSSAVADGVAGIYFDSLKDYYQLAKDALQPFGENPEHILKYWCDTNNIKASLIEDEIMLIRGTSDAPLAHNFNPLSMWPPFDQ